MNYPVKVLELARRPHKDDKARRLPSLDFKVTASNVDQAREMARKHLEKDHGRVLRGLACTTDGGLAAVVFSD